MNHKCVKAIDNFTVTGDKVGCVYLHCDHKHASKMPIANDKFTVQFLISSVSGTMESTFVFLIYHFEKGKKGKGRFKVVLCSSMKYW